MTPTGNIGFGLEGRAGELFAVQAEGLTAGSVVAERYEVLELVGYGGMSLIYKARHQLMNRVVALKMLHARSLLDPAGLKRFQQEAQAASLLDHPGVIRVYDFGILPGDQPYLVMDFVEGVSLTNLIEKKKKLSYEYCLPLFIQVADALAHAHAKGVLHRDLKPCNVMVVETNGVSCVKVVDFGLATFLPDAPIQGAKLTQTGEVFGSVHYMSPEQCCGKKLDERSDIYAFGCVMYECLTGKPPIQGDSIVETMQKQVTTNPVPMTVFTGGEKFPPKLEQVIMRTLKKSPEDRYQSMEEIYDELLRISGAEPPERPVKPQSARSKKLRVSLAKIGYGVAAGLAVLLLAMFLTKPPGSNTADQSASAFANNSLTRVVDKGEKLIESGEYVEGERVLTAAADHAEKFNVQDDAVTDRISSLAQLCHKRGQCDTAERLLKRSLSISEKLFGEKDPRTAERVQDLAAFYMSLGDYEKAEQLYDRVMPPEQARKKIKEASASETSEDSSEAK
jgi:serine/threonine protein kinase